MTTAALDHALAYAELGWRVVPIIPGTKRPAVADWPERATTDPSTIQEWWTKNPNHGVGIATGAGSGILGLDVDGSSGADSLRDLEMMHGDLPSTVEQITGGGGRHLLFAWPELGPGQSLGNSAGRLGKGLDVRAAGGQLLAAPSVHPDTGARYEWEVEHAPGQVPLAPVPAWLLSLLLEFHEPLPEGQVGPAAAADVRFAGDRYTWGTGWRERAVSLLERHGWHSTTKPDHQGVVYMTRPGKRAAEGWSCSIGKVAPGVVYVFTGTAAPLEAERGYRLHELYAVLEHGGDRIAADAALVAEGWGAPTHIDPAVTAALIDDAKGVPAGSIPVLPPSFWTARLVLELIRQAAHSRTRSADLVLHSVLARLCAYMRHTFELPPIVGSVGSLNYFAAVIGRSGAGKSSGVAIAEEIVPKPAGLDVAERTLGSGEGVAANYMGTIELPSAEGGRKKVEHGQVRNNAHIYVDEGQALTAMMERSGATISESLRRAWSGQALGQANASAERNRVIPAGQYRLGLVIGFQPTVAGELLADATAGTPQRFMWASAEDPWIPVERPPFPGPLPIGRIDPDVLEAHKIIDRGHVRHRMGVAPEICAEVQQAAHAQATGSVAADELNSHRNLHLLKTAGLLAILEGRLDITLEDWGLAKTMWATSCAVRQHVADLVQESASEKESARLARVGRTAQVDAASRLTAPATVDRQARLLAVKVHEADGGLTRGALRKTMKSNRRELLFDSALEEAIGQGWIDELGDRLVAGKSRPT